MGKENSPIGVTSGVLQGSVLGPVLFLIYINCIVENFTCKYNIFADDSKMNSKLNLNASFILLDLSWCPELKINLDKIVAFRYSHSTVPNPPPC